jgi:hypothetical protein
VLLIKGGLLGVTLVVNTWLTTTFWGGSVDPAVPVYALGGLGGLALAAQYLRHLRPQPPRASLAAVASATPVGAAHTRVI